MQPARDDWMLSILVALDDALGSCCAFAEPENGHAAVVPPAGGSSDDLELELHALAATTMTMATSATAARVLSMAATIFTCSVLVTVTPTTRSSS